MRKWLLVVVLSLLSVAMGGCGSGIAPVSEGRTLTIISGSENETLEPLIQEWAKKNNAQIEMTFLGSVDISRMLQTGAIAYDAVWPANALWLAFGDEQNIVQHEQSIMRSPVVFAVKRSTANRLGWINAEVTMQDILVAAQSGDVRFMMTSATQSNSGSSFYFAALTAFAAQGDVITAESLADPQVQTLISNFLGTVDRSSGSSGWLKDLFLRTYDLYDGDGEL
jgi:Ca-activated chloride channel family protein